MRTYGNSIDIAHPGCNFIGGAWRPAHGQSHALIDPSTEATHDGFVLGGVEEVEAAIAAARESFDKGPWPSMAPDERGRLIARMTQFLSERRGELEEAWTLQVGALATMRGRAVDNGIGHFRRAAEQAHILELERRAQSLVGDAIIRQEPVGVVAAIAAWNGTLLQARCCRLPARSVRRSRQGAPLY
jgi:aldehyde dehydrogenase (NAD+)